MTRPISMIINDKVILLDQINHSLLLNERLLLKVCKGVTVIIFDVNTPQSSGDDDDALCLRMMMNSIHCIILNDMLLLSS